MITTGSYPDLNLVRDTFEKVGYDEYESFKTQIPMHFTSIKSKLQTVSFTSVGDVLPAVPFSGVIPVDEARRGYTVTVVPIEFVTGRSMTKRAVEVLQWPEVVNMGKSMARSIFLKQETLHGYYWNGAFSTTVSAGMLADGYNPVGGDGVSLCSASHPANPEGMGPTARSNILAAASALTAASLSTAFNEAILILTDRGNPHFTDFDELWVGPANRTAANIALYSEYNPAISGSNAVNTSYRQMRPVVNRYMHSGITGGFSFHWFLVNSNRAKENCFFITTPDGFEMFSDVASMVLVKTFGARQVMGLRFKSWDHIYGVEATS